MACNLSHPCHNTLTDARPVRLVSFQPPNLASSRYAHDIVGAVAGNGSFILFNHNSFHAFGDNSYSQLGESGCSLANFSCNIRVAIKPLIVTNLSMFSWL